MILFVKNNYDELSTMGYSIFNTIEHFSTGELEVQISRSELIVIFNPNYELLSELKRCGANPDSTFIVLSEKRERPGARDHIFYRYSKTIIRCQENDCPIVLDSFLSLMNDSQSFGANIIDMKNNFKSDSVIYFENIIGDVNIDKIKNIPIRGKVKSMLAAVFYNDDLLFDDIELWFKWINEFLNTMGGMTSYRKKSIYSSTIGIFLSIEEAE